MKILLLTALALLIAYAIKKRQYDKTEYHQQTRTPYLKVQFDKGRLGEFYTYECLKPLEGHKRWLFNVYVPKAHGETTELDVVLSPRLGRADALPRPGYVTPPSLRDLAQNLLFFCSCVGQCYAAEAVHIA